MDDPSKLINSFYVKPHISMDYYENFTLYKPIDNNENPLNKVEDRRNIRDR